MAHSTVFVQHVSQHAHKSFFQPQQAAVFSITSLINPQTTNYNVSKLVNTVEPNIFSQENKTELKGVENLLDATRHNNSLNGCMDISLDEVIHASVVFTASCTAPKWSKKTMNSGLSL